LRIAQNPRSKSGHGLNVELFASDVCTSVTIDTNERGVEHESGGVTSAAPEKPSNSNVSFNAHGVNFYLRLGAAGKKYIMSKKQET